MPNSWKKVVVESGGEAANGTITQDTTGSAGSLLNVLPIAQGGTNRSDLNSNSNSIDGTSSADGSGGTQGGVLIYHNTGGGEDKISKLSASEDNMVLSYTVGSGRFDFVPRGEMEEPILDAYVQVDDHVTFGQLTITGELTVGDAIVYGGEYQYTTGNAIVLNSDGSGFNTTEQDIASTATNYAGLEVQTSAPVSGGDPGARTHLQFIHSATNAETFNGHAGQWTMFNTDNDGAIDGEISNVLQMQISAGGFSNNSNSPKCGIGTLGLDTLEGGSLYLCTDVS